MEIFISWSGNRSKLVAEALRDWIPDVIQTVEPWVSGRDIEAGARWNRVMQGKLSDIRFGIICLTSDNLNAPWILFETGALAKTLEETFVCPYLIDLKPSDLPQGPLTQFQAKQATKEGTQDLIQAINKAMGEALPDDKLRKAFERWWPDLERTLDDLPEPEDKGEAKRPVEEMVEEVLMMVRDLTRRLPYEEAITLDPARIIIMALQEAGVDDDEIGWRVARSLGMSLPDADSLVKKVRYRLSAF